MAYHRKRGDHLDHFENLHDLAEEIYWDSRERASTERRALSHVALSGPATSLRFDLRVWDFFYPKYNCPLLKERIGRLGDGGKWVCGLRTLLQGRSCLVYSIGSAGDTSFELEVINRTSCEVHTFDHTLGDHLRKQMAKVAGLSFHPIGIGDPSSGAGLQKLDQIMMDLGHEWVDVLKIDIETFEWELFSDFYASEGATLPATQLLVEFHWNWSHHVPGPSPAITWNQSLIWDVFDKLEADNFRVFAVEPNYYCDNGCCAGDFLEFAFIKVSPNGQICTPGRSDDMSKAGKVALPYGCVIEE
ncbi:probable methyltransferase-like protein 24 [Coccomyxa sp. Obi]|nr:probable methyltransferase-like protein 24 [Coccomyxa sp. Obi]